MPSERQIQIHERLATLEQQVNDILINHLPHLQVGINDLSKKFWAVIILLIANLMAVVIKLYVK